MKKILFLINTLGTGGAEHVLVDIVNNLDPQKFDITIMTIYDTNVYKNQLHDNIKVVSYYKTHKNKFIDKITKKILYLKLMNLSPEKLYNLIFGKNNYDIEIAFLEGLPTKIISGSTNNDSKKIAWVHCDLKNNKESNIFFKSEEEQINTYKKFNEVYCVSDISTQAFKERFNINNNVYTLYNIVDTNKIIAKSNEQVFLSKDFNIITVGRLTYQKGFCRLIDGYSNALKKFKIKTHLYIIGSGEENNKIKQKIEASKISNFVTLLGNQSNPYKYMAKGDLYVCSSYSEGFPLVIIEALTLKLPVLTTDCGVQNKLLNNGKFGLIVENNMDALAEGLIYLINTPSKIEDYKKNISKYYNSSKENLKKIESQLLK